MIALVDTNVVLDVMLWREPHLAASSAMLAAVETGRCRGLLCATPVTTIHHIAERQPRCYRLLDGPADSRKEPVDIKLFVSELHHGSDYDYDNDNRSVSLHRQRGRLRRGQFCASGAA